MIEPCSCPLCRSIMSTAVDFTGWFKINVRDGQIVGISVEEERLNDGADAERGLDY